MQETLQKRFFGVQENGTKNRRTKQRAAEEEIYGFGLILTENETVAVIVVVPRRAFCYGVPLRLRAEVTDCRNARAAPGNDIALDLRDGNGNDKLGHNVDVAECTASDRRDACGNHGIVRAPNELVRGNFDEGVAFA